MNRSQNSCYRYSASDGYWSGFDTLLQGSTMKVVTSTPNGLILTTSYDGTTHGLSGWYSTDNGQSWASVVLGQSNGLEIEPVYSMILGPSGRVVVSTWAGIFSRQLPDGPLTHAADAPAGDVLAMSGNGMIFATTNVRPNIYRSSDFGATWQPSGSGLSSIGAITVCPNGSVFATANRGVFRSTVSDTNWRWVSALPLSAWGNDYQTLAADSSGRIFIGSIHGVYRSNDNGSSWQLSRSGLLDTNIVALCVTSTGDIVASSYSRLLYRSTDHGVTWERFNRGLSDGLVAMFAADSAGTLFAASSNGLFCSSDRGDNWDVCAMQDTGVTSVMALRDGAIVISRQAVGEIFRSTDHGASWKGVFNEGLVNQPYGIVSKSYAGTLFALPDASHLYRSTDDGRSWVGPTTVPYFQLIAAAPDGGLFGYLTCSSAQAIYHSTDDGITWSTVRDHYPAGAELLHADSSGDYFLYCDGLMRSTDAGLSWEMKSTGIQGGISSYWAPESFVVNQIGRLYIATSAGVFRSTDHGENWAAWDDGISKKQSGNFGLLPDGTMLLATDEGIFRTGQSTLTAPVQTPEPLAQLDQSIPNPLITNTAIRYSLSRSNEVWLEVSDLLGRVVLSTYQGIQDAGSHTITIDRAALPLAGTYLYRLRTGAEYSETRTMIVLP
ncbi:MAG: T9SS type A sorting domain-containing protein [Bacteroidetes bacterium]|nr:T9SS type A sorting domain-containing protein [Bacteroidota bacterium]